VTLHRLDVLCPEVFAADGGVQMYCRTLIRGLRQVRPHAHVRVFTRNDHPHHIPATGWPGIQWIPCGGSNLRLTAELIRHACRRDTPLLIGTIANFGWLQRLHRRLSGAEQWCSAHGIEVWRAGPLRRAGIHGLNRLLPVSRFTADALRRQLGPTCPPLSILPNSYNSATFSPGPAPEYLRQRYGLHPGQPLIFCLTRLLACEPYKNVEPLIRSIPQLLPRFPDLRLLIAGQGDDLPRLRSIAAQLGLHQAVIFTGHLPAAELADHFRLASLFALPSEKEGFGIVFLEALGCGCPVLAGNRDGSVDPLADGAFGLLVDPAQPLAPPLQALLERRGPDLWYQPEALAAAVNARFGFDAFCRQLDGLLTQHGFPALDGQP
jgi:glycosyltransferase involved in cell wall biosynthesis